MKLWFDEDLSPSLVRVANDLELEATCNRDRKMLGATDADLRRIVQAEGYVFATDNLSDFRPMYSRDGIHPGLLALPAGDSRSHQQELLRIAVASIIRHAADAGEPPADFMVNKLFAITADGDWTVADLPPA